MPQRTDIHKVLIIGSGPIIIGQACEFDYSGTQACKALRSLGYEIVLVNSNPATIMTDPEMADVTYIEPLNVDRLEQIIDKERPDALLPNLGGQSGLNLASELYKEGILDKYGVKVIGVQVDAIERGEDRVEFKKTMQSLGIEMARSEISYSVDEALEIADKLGYPVVLRPAYTMGGEGGGLVYNKEELKVVCARGLQASLVHQVLVEECVTGWEELELEVVRDKDNNMITVCFIENVDPMGVHTGDSFCTAPMLTISQDVMDRLQEQATRSSSTSASSAARTSSLLTTRSLTASSSSRSTPVRPVPRPSRPRPPVSRSPWSPPSWPPVSRSRNFRTASTAPSTSTSRTATTSSSNSPAGPLRSSRASKTSSALR